MKHAPICRRSEARDCSPHRQLSAAARGQVGGSCGGRHERLAQRPTCERRRHGAARRRRRSSTLRRGHARRRSWLGALGRRQRRRRRCQRLGSAPCCRWRRRRRAAEGAACAILRPVRVKAHVALIVTGTGADDDGHARRGAPARIARLAPVASDVVARHIPAGAVAHCTLAYAALVVARARAHNHRSACCSAPTSVANDARCGARAGIAAPRAAVARSRSASGPAARWKDAAARGVRARERRRALARRRQRRTSGACRTRGQAARVTAGGTPRPRRGTSTWSAAF